MRFLAFFLLFMMAGTALAAQKYRVETGTGQWIYEHAVCKHVANASGFPLMVPTNSATGWSSFYSNSHVGVSLSNPSCPAAGSVACNSPANNQCGVYCGYVGTNCAGCGLPWGGSISHGQSATAYASASVACGNSCASQTRTCSDGSLSGSYTASSCSVTACAGCGLPWGGSISHGQSVTAYASASVACGNSCASQTRTCSNGSLSGSYTASSCSVGACSNCFPGCNAPGQTCGNNYLFVSASSSETIYASVGTGISDWYSFSCGGDEYRPSVSDLQAFCSAFPITDGNGFWSSQEDGGDKAIMVVDGCGTYSGFKTSAEHKKCFRKVNEDCR